MACKGLAKPPTETCILVTGGVGFIGTHTVVALLERGYKVVVVDNLFNSSAQAIDRVRQIAGIDEDDPTLVFEKVDILDKVELSRVFDQNDIDAVIHFAGYKAVGESVEKPLEYYWNNISGTLMLAQVMAAHDVKNIVFSSSATVYGVPDSSPIDESFPRHEPTNPYSQSKFMIERILADLYTGDPEWDIVILRYFNPIGAHESGLIGEDPKGTPNNLTPYVAKVAVGRLPYVGVFGDDYNTPDGTGVRDYIHVVDLAMGHVDALDWMAGRVGSPSGDVECMSSFDVEGPRLADGTRTGVGVFNLGTGKGSSVLEVIEAFKRASGVDIPYKILPRRAGDIDSYYASSDKAARELGWKAQRTLEEACADIWHWQSNNPDGFQD